MKTEVGIMGKQQIDKFTNCQVLKEKGWAGEKWVMREDNLVSGCK